MLEVDELQHFTPYKSIALEAYPIDAELGFDLAEYISLCQRYGMEALSKGPLGYRASKPEFPFEYGRAAQRAYFDAFRDLLAPLHGLRPTLRIPLAADEVSAVDVRRRVTEHLSQWAGEIPRQPARGIAPTLHRVANAGGEPRSHAAGGEAPAEQRGCLWSRIKALVGEEVQLLGPSRKHITVLDVGPGAVAVRKSRGNDDDIDRHLIEGVAGDVCRRGRMTRKEILEHIGQYHSSAICALLVATGQFQYTTNPITLLPAPDLRASH